MIYDRVGEVVRRYGKNGWKVVADNECLQQFFAKHGDWRVLARKPETLSTVHGGNEIEWESRPDSGAWNDVVYIEHTYCGGKAKILRGTLEKIVAKLKKWQAAK